MNGDYRNFKIVSRTDCAVCKENLMEPEGKRLNYPTDHNLKNRHKWKQTEQTRIVSTFSLLSFFLLFTHFLSSGGCALLDIVTQGFFVLNLNRDQNVYVCCCKAVFSV